MKNMRKNLKRLLYRYPITTSAYITFVITVGMLLLGYTNFNQLITSVVGIEWFQLVLFMTAGAYIQIFLLAYTIDTCKNLKLWYTGSQVVAGVVALILGIYVYIDSYNFLGFKISPILLLWPVALIWLFINVIMITLMVISTLMAISLFGSTGGVSNELSGDK